MTDTINGIQTVGDNDSSAGRSQLKKRRIPGACDICKKKKIRCDSGEMPDNRCSNCVQYGFDCTHKEVTKTLGSAKGYVESLEARLEKMDRLLSKLLPGIDVNSEIDNVDSSREPSEPAKILPRNDDERTSPMLTMQLRRLKLSPETNRYFGRSSGYQLVQTALDLKQEYTGESAIPKGSIKRHEFWDVPPWCRENPELDDPPPDYAFPDEDLMPSLIDAYFEQINPFMPLLHRPTFERLVTENRQLTDTMFGAVLLLVCAHGARFSEDPRVLADGFEHAQRSAGWKWFEQVRVLRKSLFKKTTLYELQMHALHVMFAQGSEIPQGIYAQIGLATRLTQEVGAHRKRRKPDAPTVEDELWKRAFWVILSLDRNVSSFSGRPCGLQDEDLDVELPIECDDEYWESGFQQPVDKPSIISFFNVYLKLMDILAYAMRLIYSIKHPSNFFGQSSPRSDQQIIAELDSAMNNWMDSVPSHLRWNPYCGNELFFKQSAALHASYYHLQIFIHRPFIPSPRNPGPVSFPSLAICTNAARSCCHVLETFSGMGSLPLAQLHPWFDLQRTAFTAAVILLLNIWSGKRSGYAPNPKREMEDVQRCISILKNSERRWAAAGRYWDILSELASAGDVPIATWQPSSTTVNPGRKRSREAETDEEMSPPRPSSQSVSPTTGGQQNRSIAGSRRVSLSQSTAATTPLTPTRMPALFSLPMYSNELGRLPIYGQFSFSDSLGNSMPFQAQISPDAAVMQNSNIFDHFILSNLLAGNPEGVSAGGSNNLFASNAATFGFGGSSSQIHANPGNNTLNTQARTNGMGSNTFQINGNIPYVLDSSNQWSGFGNLPLIDNDTMTVWSTAPTNLELDEWNSYISSVEQMTQAQSHSTGDF